MNILKNRRGDTILEVLIAVTVLSLVLTSTFALANRNVQATRQAAERGEAYKIAQSEMEKLKLYASSPGAVMPEEGEYFCMSPLADKLVILGSESDGPEDPDSDAGFTYPAYKKAETDGCKSDGDLYYKLVQRGTTATGSQNTYTSSVRWPAVTGDGVDQVNIVHRLYPDLSYDTLPPAGSPVITPTPCYDNNNIAVGLDVSGSMDFIFTGSTKRITAAKNILNTFFEDLRLNSNGNRASLSVFSGVIPANRNLVPMTTDTDLLNTELGRITPQAPNPLAATDMYWGITAPYQTLLDAQPADPRARKYLILVTDGAHESSVHTVNQVRNQATLIKANGVKIYTVGIYPGSDPSFTAGEQLLQQIASPSGAGAPTYTSADNPAQLASILGQLSFQLDCAP